MSPDEYQTRLAQIQLSDDGYYKGAIDGIWGPVSTTAAKQWFSALDKSKISNSFSGSLRALAAQFHLRFRRYLYLADLDGQWGPLSQAAALGALTQDKRGVQPANPVPTGPLAPDTRHHSLPYDVAKQYLGQKEIPGKANNPIILRWLRTLASWVATEEVAWCSAFLNYCAVEAGYEATGSLAARSWLNVGEPIALDQARKGDVVILWRVSRTSWEGHVAFLDHYNATRGLLYLLGGNQNNAVNITSYAEDQLLGVRRLRSLDKLQGNASNV